MADVLPPNPASQPTSLPHVSAVEVASGKAPSSPIEQCRDGAVSDGRQADETSVCTSRSGGWRTSCDCEVKLADLRQRSQQDFEIEFFERVICRDPHYVEVLSALADRLSEKGWYQRAAALDQRLVQLRPRDPNVRYNWACSLTRICKLDEAISALAQSVRLGFRNHLLMETDEDLAPLRGDHRFERLLARLKHHSR